MNLPLFIPVLNELEQGLTWMLEWLHTTDWLWPGPGGIPWAWSIVATTIIVRTILLPLTVRQIHSMQRLQAHAPEMKAIQQRYKQDRAKQQEELMKFYRENKINPASSCLPILFQIPVFLGLFFVLRDFDSEVLAKAKYMGTDSLTELGWLHIVPDITQNLSEDTLSMVVLLILYATSQTASTYFMSSTMDKMQRYLLLALPLIFLFFVINFPAGLMIYWVTTNLWTTGQGLVTRQLRPKPVPPEKRSSRTPPGGGVDGKAKAEADAPAAPSAPPRRVKRKKKRARR
jgi:YidC/Oxa1 family membrane protein insertase